MPTYDYRCKACNHEFEEFQSMSAKPLKKCPECGKAQLERLIGTGAALIFKGSGFYETDYRSKDYQKAKESESKEGTETKAKESGSDDSSSKKKSDEKKGAETRAVGGSGDGVAGDGLDDRAKASASESG